ILSGLRAVFIERDWLAKYDLPLGRSGQKPEWTKPRESRRDGEKIETEELGEIVESVKDRIGLFGANYSTGDDRTTGLETQSHEPATSKPLQSITILEQLLDALGAFRKHGNKMLTREQSLGVFWARSH